jgi:hypothetical protein
MAAHVLDKDFIAYKLYFYKQQLSISNNVLLSLRSVT